MYAEISAALSSLKTLTDIVRAANSMSNRLEMLDAVTSVQQNLSQALAANLAGVEKQMALLQRVTELEAQVAELGLWDRKSKDYRLQAVGSSKRHFAQVYHPGTDSPQVRHWACAKCFQERQVFVLNATQGTGFHGRDGYKCPNCATVIEPSVTIGIAQVLAPIDSAYV